MPLALRVTGNQSPIFNVRRVRRGGFSFFYTRLVAFLKSLIMLGKRTANNAGIHSPSKKRSRRDRELERKFLESGKVSEQDLTDKDIEDIYVRMVSRETFMSCFAYRMDPEPPLHCLGNTMTMRTIIRRMPPTQFIVTNQYADRCDRWHSAWEDYHIPVARGRYVPLWLPLRGGDGGYRKAVFTALLIGAFDTKWCPERPLYRQFSRNPLSDHNVVGEIMSYL